MPDLNQDQISVAGVAAMIDHTALKPETREADIRKLCDEARHYQFASVCVNPTWVALAAEVLAGSGVKVCTVIGFPLGATLTVVKGYETQAAIAAGADEVDMVINVGWLKGGNTKGVQHDIAAVVDAAKTAQTSRSTPVLVKVIIETVLLNDEEKRTACTLAKAAGADFVKTSTGFSGGGATVADIALIRATVGDEMGVKASGGVRTAADALALIAAGATRLGASAGVQIIQGLREEAAPTPSQDGGGTY